MNGRANRESLTENLWLHSAHLVEPNYWIRSEYMFPSNWIENFILHFNEQDNKKRILLEDFGVEGKEVNNKVKVLVEAIFSRATWDIGSDYTPVPTFLVIMLIDYCVHFLRESSAQNLRPSTQNQRSYKQNKEDFVKIADQILSEPNIPSPIIHKLVLSMNPYFIIGLDSNPSLTDEDRTLFALNFGMRVPHEYSPLVNPIFSI